MSGPKIGGAYKAISTGLFTVMEVLIIVAILLSFFVNVWQAKTVVASTYKLIHLF